MTERVIYPRFLGMDGSGDFVWELASGRWTWGDDPHAALTRERTFDPERYVEKYGRPVPLGEQIDRQAEAKMEPSKSLAKLYPSIERTSTTAEADKLAGAVNALAAMERAVKGWAEGSAENEEALGRRDRKPSDEQPFVLADILRMIDDAAREVGVAPVYSV